MPLSNALFMSDGASLNIVLMFLASPFGQKWKAKFMETVMLNGFVLHLGSKQSTEVAIGTLTQLVLVRFSTTSTVFSHWIVCDDHQSKYVKVPVKL